MSTPFPAIKNFYSPIASASQKPTPSKSSSPPPPPSPSNGDSLTLSPLLRDPTRSPSQWSSPYIYTSVNISSLSPGPHSATFTCRIINIYDQPIESKMPHSAKGCLKLLVKDNTATLLIKLYYASTTYDLRLGTHITCWTTHIHSASSLSGINDTGTGTATVPPSPIMTSIFPERDSGCHIQIHDEEGRMSASSRIPLGYGNGDPLNGLMSLDHFINLGGADIPEARLLVCVGAVGDPVSVTTRNNSTFLTLSCTITDASLSATLSVSSPLFTSARSWIRNRTILLLSSPRLRRTRLTLTSRSHVEIDPDIPDADVLRRTVQRANCPINQLFPEGVFDVQAITSAQTRLQFTFHSLCESISDLASDCDSSSHYSPSSADGSITGYLSVILTRVNITELVRRNMLFSMECCGMPVYGNCAMGRCGQCAQMVGLRVNPDLIGGMADETGGFGIGIASGFLYGGNTGSRTSPTRGMTGKNQQSPLLWSDAAWCQLLGRSAEELAEFCREDVSVKQKTENANVLRYLEQRLQWMRVVLLVVWMVEVDGGRLAVLRVVA